MSLILDGGEHYWRPEGNDHNNAACAFTVQSQHYLLASSEGRTDRSSTYVRHYHDTKWLRRFPGYAPRVEPGSLWICERCQSALEEIAYDLQFEDIEEEEYVWDERQQAYRNVDDLSTYDYERLVSLPERLKAAATLTYAPTRQTIEMNARLDAAQRVRKHKTSRKTSQKGSTVTTSIDTTVSLKTAGAQPTVDDVEKLIARVREVGGNGESTLNFDQHYGTVNAIVVLTESTPTQEPSLEAALKLRGKERVAALLAVHEAATTDDEKAAVLVALTNRR